MNEALRRALYTVVDDILVIMIEIAYMPKPKCYGLQTSVESYKTYQLIKNKKHTKHLYCHCLKFAVLQVFRQDFIISFLTIFGNIIGINLGVIYKYV